ncbi:MAG: hypothetical protein ACYTKD_23295 [Planctomycetota bacterium]|jgi:hypothetical protein
MAAPNRATGTGFLAAVRAALRPEFRPRWWEFAITFGLLALAYPLVTRVFWLGGGMAFATVSGYVVVCGLPVAITVLSILWKSPDPRAKAAARALLQLAIVIVMLVILRIAGGIAYHASIEQSRRNGLVVVQEIHSFRERHGRLPRSLEEVERSGDRKLPGPTFGGEFGYELQENGYLLQFKLPTGLTFVHDSRREGGRSDGGGAEEPPEGAGPEAAAD